MEKWSEIQFVRENEMARHRKQRKCRKNKLQE
jgi:hypothetical protein